MITKDTTIIQGGSYEMDKTFVPQLRMQALELILTMVEGIEQYQELKDKTPFKVADMFVHYCLTGEHQLPEKKG